MYLLLKKLKDGVFQELETTLTAFGSINYGQVSSERSTFLEKLLPTSFCTDQTCARSSVHPRKSHRRSPYIRTRPLECKPPHPDWKPAFEEKMIILMVQQLNKLESKTKTEKEFF